MTEQDQGGDRRATNPAVAASAVAPKIGHLFRRRTAAIEEYRELARKAARSDADYDATRQTVKMKKRLLDGVSTNAEAETWADVDPEVVQLNFERKLDASMAKAKLLEIDNLADELRILHTLLAKERDDDKFHARYGA